MRFLWVDWCILRLTVNIRSEYCTVLGTVLAIIILLAEVLNNSLVVIENCVERLLAMIPFSYYCLFFLCTGVILPLLCLVFHRPPSFYEEFQHLLYVLTTRPSGLYDTATSRKALVFYLLPQLRSTICVTQESREQHNVKQRGNTKFKAMI